MAVAVAIASSSTLLKPPPRMFMFGPSTFSFNHLCRVSSLPPNPLPFTSRISHQQFELTHPHSSLHPNLLALAPEHAAASREPNPLDKLLNGILETVNSRKKPAIAALLLSLLVLGVGGSYSYPYCSFAASGGRMGGSCFSSYSSSSSSGSRSSSSSSSNSSRSSPSYSYSSSSNSSSSPKSSGSKSSSSNSSTSSPSFSYSSSSKSSSSSSKSSGSKSSSSSSSRSSPSYSYSFSSSSSSSSSSDSLPYSSSQAVPTSEPVVSSRFQAPWFFLGFLLGCSTLSVLAAMSQISKDNNVHTETQKTSVIKIQVGLSGKARSFQRNLDQLAEKADTSTPAGLSYVLTETTLALLRHLDSCISAYSSVEINGGVQDGEKRFNQLSIEERGKFDEETLVNVNNIKMHKSASQSLSNVSNEFIVITILVAAQGVNKLPEVNSSSDLKIALQKLGSIPSSKLMGVEVLWTPQSEGDTLSEKELLEDYPVLRIL
ncbi:myelin-associated oligodendrocyte basic protein [Rhynchospora pubera]|uniref:Myelin-associated oligodendrocyte basic protein n=1 Tax=Rhynchospora pubera TaxID=906938 RepID=A0AAV8G492_9POAL|nr:myelin-associated oligodendrocyte basic protein [Rhynchospora pubera]